MNDGTAAPADFAIRPARPGDFAVLQQIELEAGRAFGEIGMHEVASDDPFSIAELDAYHAAGHAWVAADGDDRPIAYLVVDIVDGNLHIEQVSVRPAFGRRGIGLALIDHVARWAQALGMPAVTLTTFRDVAWNAPYYQSRGFRTLTAGEITPGLAAIRAHEADEGLDRWPRVCMRREIEAEASG